MRESYKWKDFKFHVPCSTQSTCRLRSGALAALRVMAQLLTPFNVEGKGSGKELARAFIPRLMRGVEQVPPYCVVRGVQSRHHLLVSCRCCGFRAFR